MLDILIRLIYKKRQYVKFIIAGGTAAFTDLTLLYIFTDILGWWYLISAAIAFIIAFFVSFFLQKFWTFRDNNRERIYKQMGQYFLVGTVNLTINTLGMYILVDKLNIMYLFAQMIMMVLIAIGSFLIYRFVIFKKHKREGGQEEVARKKRILIATGIFPPDIGGPATMLEAMAHEFIKNDFQVKILTYAEDSKKSKGNFEVIRVNKKKKWKKFCFLKKMYKYSDWADVIYVTDTYSVGYFAYLMKKYLDKKYVLRFAGDSAWETAVAQGWTSDYIVDFQEKKYSEEIESLKNRRSMIMKNADTVIAVSNFMKDLATKIGVQEDKIKVIYNSTDFVNKENIDDKKIQDLKNKYGQDKKIVVTSCRLTAWKGVDGIIKILPKLKEKVGAINFLVLGDGPEMDNLKKLAHERGVENEVHFLGRVQHSETFGYFKAADLYILNTNYEGLSHALLDVMEVGAPIITTNVGGNPEVIESEENGILVEYNNEEELLDACEKVLNDEELQNKFVQNSKEKLNKFRWENTVKETISVLSKYV